MRPGDSVEIQTDAGCKTLELQASGPSDGRRLTFRAAMGQPEQVQRRTIDVDGTPVDAVTLRVGNPQCVVLGDVTVERLHSVAARLAVHPVFPEGFERRARARRGARSRPDPDLGARRRADRGVGHGRLRGGGRGDRLRRRRARRAGHRPRRRAARRVERRRPVSYRLGGSPVRGALGKPGRKDYTDQNTSVFSAFSVAYPCCPWLVHALRGLDASAAGPWRTLRNVLDVLHGGVELFAYCGQRFPPPWRNSPRQSPCALLAGPCARPRSPPADRAVPSSARAPFRRPGAATEAGSRGWRRR